VRRLGLVVMGIGMLSTPPAWAQLAESGPLLPSERRTTTVSRSVPAGEYRDAYCARWTDGCTTCTRRSVNRDPVCSTEAGAAACKTAPVECRAPLRTIGRVCLTWTDGCNPCRHPDFCLMIECRRPNDFYCRSPRAERYPEEPGASISLLWIELIGLWRLVSPGGRSCDLSFFGPLQLHPRCSSLPEGDRMSDAKLEGRDLKFLDRDRNPILSFRVENNFDDLASSAPSAGWRLVRLDPMPSAYWMHQGEWRLSLTGSQSNCTLSLAMAAGPSDGDPLVEPRTVRFAPGCIEIASRLPKWKTFDSDGGDIIMRESEGRETRFDGSNDRFSAGVAEPHAEPGKVLIERMRSRRRPGPLSPLRRCSLVSPQARTAQLLLLEVSLREGSSAGAAGREYPISELEARMAMSDGRSSRHGRFGIGRTIALNEFLEPEK
jgi:hypothetical protein